MFAANLGCFMACRASGPEMCSYLEDLSISVWICFAAI